MSRDDRDGTAHTTPTRATDGGPSDTDEDDEDTRSILVELPEWQFHRLRNSKEKHGRTWKGLLIDGRRYNECDDGDDDE